MQGMYRIRMIPLCRRRKAGFGWKVGGTKNGDRLNIYAMGVR